MLFKSEYFKLIIHFFLKLNNLSLEDSHVDNFYAFCSPSVLLRNKSWVLDEDLMADDDDSFERNRDMMGHHRLHERRGMGTPTNHTIEQFTLMENSQGYYEDDYLYGNKSIIEKETSGKVTTSLSTGDSKRMPLILIENESQRNSTTTRTTSGNRNGSKSKQEGGSTLSKLSSLRTLRLEETFSCNDPKKMAEWIANTIEEDAAADENDEESKANTTLNFSTEEIIQKRLEFVDATPKADNKSDLTQSRYLNDESPEVFKSFSFMNITK